MAPCCGKGSSIKQDSLWSWFICFCSTICMILTVGFAFAFGVLFPVLMESFEESRERTAWVSSVTLAVFSFSGPVMGAFVNRYGCRVAFIVGGLLCAVGLALGSRAPSLWVLNVVFSVPFGIGVSFVYVSAPMTVTQYFKRRRSVALGIVTAGQGLGTMILGPTLQALVDAFAWRNTFLIMAGVLALAGCTGFFHKGHLQSFGSSSSLRTTNSKKFSWNFSVWKNPKFVVLMLLAGVVNFSRIVPYVHLIKHCRDDLGIPADKSSTLLLFVGLFAGTGRLSAGFLCDLRCINSQFLYQIAVFISGASILLLVVAKTYSGMIAVVVVFSLADGLLVSTFIIELFKSVEESQRASCLGFCMMAAGVSLLCSPPLSGLIADNFGTYLPAFLVAGGIEVVASLIPFVLLCIQRESNTGCNEIVYLEELMDKDQDGPTKKESKCKSDATAAISTLMVNMESSEPVARRTTLARASHKRPVSFMWAMESPFYASPT